MKITRKGYYEVYRPDGSYVSRHTSRDESYEAITEDGQNGTYRIVCPDREVEVEGNDVGLIVGPSYGGGAGPSGDYTPTHFVAPYASVSGATSDWDTANGTAFSSATSISTPCTLGEAMANATAGNVIECAEGVYLGNSTVVAERQDSYFEPTNSGTSGSPIIFYAKYPAANNYGLTSLYSEVRKQNIFGGALGIRNQNYIIFDGFYLNEQHNEMNGGDGCVQAFVAENCEFRRLAFDRYDHSYPTNQTSGPIYIDGTINQTITDCHFTGRIPVGAHHNNAAIIIYNSANFLITYGNFYDVDWAVYVKENADSGGNDPAPYRTDGTLSYNHINDCTVGIENQQGNTVICEYNLIEGVELVAPGAGFQTDNGPNRVGELAWIWRHNTIITDGGMGFYLKDNGDFSANMVFQDNIIYRRSGSGDLIATTAFEGSPIAFWDWTDFTINNNCYYVAAGSHDFYGRANGSNITSLAGWQTETGQEANSISSDPEFVNSSSDYRLASNSQAALTASSTSGPVGCYVTGSEEIGVRESPTY